MRAQRLLMPGSGTESWTVIDPSLIPVDPAERYLCHLATLERSPNTVRAYAHSLAFWFGFLETRRVLWDAAGVEDVAGFVVWLRAPAKTSSFLMLRPRGVAKPPSTVIWQLSSVSMTSIPGLVSGWPRA